MQSLWRVLAVDLGVGGRQRPRRDGKPRIVDEIYLGGTAESSA